MDYLEPTSFDEVWAALEQYGEDGRILAGGTALVLFMRQRLLSPACLINARQVVSSTITSDVDGLRLGAFTTHADIATSGAVQSLYTDLAKTFRKVATPRIRNAGTVGGNLVHADPHLDPPVTLLALDATVIAQSPSGARSIPLHEFFVGYYETSLRPDEVVTDVLVPSRPRRAGLAFIKFLPRSQDDYAVVDVAAWVRMGENDQVDDARVALGCVGPTPFRATAAEALLLGQPLNQSVKQAAGEAAAAMTDPEDDVRGSAAYKRELVKILVGRALDKAVADSRAGTQPITSGRLS